MSNAARLGVIAVVAVVAAIAFVALRPSAGNPGQAPLQPAAPSERPETERKAEARPRRERRPPRPQYARIRIREGAPVGGVKRIDVDAGDTARIEIASDAAGEIHLHGYDREAQVGPGRLTRLRFRADLEGIFELELHGPGTKLADLRVEP